MIGSNKNKGFTLIEMLVVVVIFSIISVSLTGVFVSSLKIQKYNLKQQQLLNQTSYFVEYMSRSIRMAKKDTIGCIDGSNFQETASSIKFATYNDECWDFYLESGQIKINKNGTVYNLTSNDLNIDSFVVSVTGDVIGDDQQPKVTFSLNIKANNVGSSMPILKIKTSISQRNLDI
ncbi:type II secretion system GspH family protein [Patescibacteria group bacterium]|nr:type II secretion system GspH family protein [Patescibacteria group bacterium]